MSDAVSIESSLIIPGGLHKYPPSWIDRLTYWIDQRRYPAWIFYAVLWAITFAVYAGIQYTQGRYPVGTINVFHVVHAGTLAYTLASLHYLDRVAARALERFRPALDISDQEYIELHYRLTTMPARPVRIATLLALLWQIMLILIVPLENWLQLLDVTSAPLSVAFITALGMALWIIAFIFIYHTFHQLILMRRIFAKYTLVDLYELGPVYGFTSLAIWTAFILVPLLAVWLLTAPWLSDWQLSLIGMLLFMLMGVIALFWPIWGIHNLLLEEKQRLLVESNQRLQKAIADLHGRVDQRHLERMDDLNKAMASLEIEQNTLRRIPTWPWQPDTIRWVAAAFMFPLVLWLVQTILERWLQ
jgi:hypothetical protein